MLDQPAETIVLRQLGQMPIERLVMVPFMPLAEFASHEEQLLAGVPIHPGVEHPEIGKLLPLVPWHFIEKRSFAVDDLVVAEDENEILLESVEERKGDIALVKTPMDGIELHISEE